MSTISLTTILDDRYEVLHSANFQYEISEATSRAEHVGILGDKNR